MSEEKKHRITHDLIFHKIPDHIAIKYVGKPICDYLISKNGLCRSLKSGIPRILGKCPRGSGVKYNTPTLSLGSRGEKKILPLHRVMAEMWVKNPHNNPVVDHINRDPLDNRVENLRWASILLNILNRSRTGQYFYVSYHKTNRHFRATVRGKHVHTSQSEIESAKAADAYIIKNGMVDYPLNFPEDYPTFHSTCGICSCLNTN